MLDHTRRVLRAVVVISIVSVVALGNHNRLLDLVNTLRDLNVCIGSWLVGFPVDVVHDEYVW